MLALATLTLGVIGLATLSRALEPKSVGVGVAPRAEEHPEAVVQAPKLGASSNEYMTRPGPNSNSFTAWIALEVPELGLELPIKAIGKSWMIEKHSSTKHSLEGRQS